MKKKYKTISTDRELSAAKPEDIKLLIKGVPGMSVLISPLGLKTFYLQAYRNKKPVMKKIGNYPDVGLKKAIEFALDKKNQIKRGEIQTKPQLENAVEEAKGELFLDTCNKYLDLHLSEWSASHLKDTKSHIRELCFGKLNSEGLGFGKKATFKIDKADVLAIINKIKERGSLHAAKDLSALLIRIFKYYNAHDEKGMRVPLELIADLEQINELISLPKPKATPALPLERLHEFFGAVFRESTSEPRTKYAILLCALTGLRGGNLVRMKLSNIDFAKNEIIMDGEDVKLGENFWIPLSKQAGAVIKLVMEINRTYEKHNKIAQSVYLFPSREGKGDDEHITADSLQKLVRGIGFNHVQTVHGLRTTFSSWANSQIIQDAPWSEQAIEHALDHRPRNKVQATYARLYKYEKERIALLEAWGQEIDSVMKKATALF
jgi:integrase